MQHTRGAGQIMEELDAAPRRLEKALPMVQRLIGIRGLSQRLQEILKDRR